MTSMDMASDSSPTRVFPWRALVSHRHRIPLQRQSVLVQLAVDGHSRGEGADSVAEHQ